MHIGTTGIHVQYRICSNSRYQCTTSQIN